MVFQCFGHAGHETLPGFVITLIITCGGILFTVVSIICLVTNTEVDPSLRTILLSFSIANVLGTVMLAYDTTALICEHEEGRLSFVMTISVMLSLSHLLLLMLDEYLTLTSNRKRTAKDFTGL